MSISPLGGQERLRATKAAAALSANSASNAAANPAGPARQADSVTISDNARSLAAARKAVADAPEVREERVKALKASIADGSYKVDSRALAARLLKNGLPS